MRCRASRFSITRVPTQGEAVLVTHRGRNIAALVPAEFGRRGNAALPVGPQQADKGSMKIPTWTIPTVPPG